MRRPILSPPAWGAAALGVFLAAAVGTYLLADGPVATPSAPQQGGAGLPAKEQFRYDGKPFTSWEYVLDTELKPERQVEALRAMAAFGRNGYGPEATAAILRAVRGYPIHAAFCAGSTSLDEDDMKVAKFAGAAVVKIGRPGLATLAQGLRDPSPDVRYFCLEALPQDDPSEAKLGVPALIAAIKDPLPEIRGKAIHKLKLIKADPDLLVPALVEALRVSHQDDDVKVEALEALKSLGPKAGPTGRVVLGCLTDGEGSVRKAALEVVESAKLDVKPAAGAVARLLAAEEEKARTGAKEGSFSGTGGLSPASSPSKAVAERDLSAPEWGPQDEAAKKGFELLQSCGADGRDAVPALVKLLKSPNAKYRTAAVIALGNIGPNAKDAAPALRDLLRTSDGKMKKVVEEAIRKILSTS